jgi:MOSC domain-containing protein YiiM
MKLVSINVGLPREVDVRGKTVLTSIFKTPVAGVVRVRQMNLEGDRQSDLTVHGGARKAVYAYPSEHYQFWRAEFPAMDLPWGAFGENFTTEGLLEATTCIGDAFRIGSAEFVVTQPRRPCFKLAIRFGREDIIRRFLASGRSGFYLSVAREGDVGVDEPITRIAHRDDAATVADILGDDRRRAERFRSETGAD